MAGWKNTIARRLPAPTLRWLKKMYYPRLVRNFPASRWPGAEIVRRLVRPGDCVVDAGANIGYVSALLARWVGPTGVVHAFEPIPETFEFLDHNMRSAGFDQVVVHACALSSDVGGATMALAEYPEGGRNLYESRIVNEGEGAGVLVRVERDTLDRLSGLWGRKVSFVKIDVEGHELDVIGGAEKLLERDRPALFIEVSGNPDTISSPAAVMVQRLASLGYGVYCAPGGKLRERRTGDRETDYFFLQPGHRDMIYSFSVGARSE